MDADIASENGTSIPDRRACISSKRVRFALALSLLILVGTSLLAALVALTPSASAQVTGPQSGEPGKPGVLGSPDCGPDWATVPSANHGTSDDNYLTGISAASANDIWAVGMYENSSAHDRTLTLHWDGSSWSTVPSPNFGGSTYDNGLYGVSAVAANDVWAVGDYFDSSIGSRTLILHWDGTTWGLVSSPNHSSVFNFLYGVAAVSPTNAWAVGYYANSSQSQALVLHWDGSTWSTTTGPSPGTIVNLYGISAISASNIWAVGSYASNQAVRTLILHWDGSVWAAVPSPNVGTAINNLNGVAALSAGNAWAVGWHGASGARKTLILRLNGSTWSTVPSPDPGTGDSELDAVTAVSPNDAWAVGYNDSANVRSTLILHWNGSSWNQVPSPNPPSSSPTLAGVTTVAANDIWAVGIYNVGIRIQTLVEQYNPCPPTPTNTPVPLPTQCAIQFEDVPNPSTFYPYVQCLACRGIVRGFACGGLNEPCDPNNDPYFRPHNNISRGQLAKIVALSARINTPVSGQSFQDVPPGSAFYTYTEQLHTMGAMGGYACGGINEPCVPPANLPYFRPHDSATRGQLAKIDSNVAGYNDLPTLQVFEDVPAGSTYYTYTYRLAGRAIMTGYPCGGSGEPCVPPLNRPYFRPHTNVTRGQTSKIVANTFYPNCQAP